MSPSLTASHSLEEWLDHILLLHPSEIDLGLDRLRRVAATLSLTELPHSMVVTVAGTNGKGTTCALLEQICLAAGMTVGVFSSPHIERYTERVRLNGHELPEQEHVKAFADIAAAQADTSLTFFEYSALGALALFASHRPQVVLLEVGLGGRLDATNLIDADLSIITTIDLDHQEYLGNTRESVGREKAGIFRAGKPAVAGDMDLPGSVVEVAEQRSSDLVRRGRDFDLVVNGDSWQFLGQHWDWQGLPLPAIPLDNAATALAALEQLWPQLPQQVVCSGLARVQVPGRLEQVGKAPRVVLDVAHNPQAAAYLTNWLREQKQQYPTARVLAVCAMLADKDVERSLAVVENQVNHWYLADLSVPRGAKAARLHQVLGQGSCFTSVAEAMNAAIADASDRDLVIVFGSFYTVAQAKELQRTRN